MVGNALPFAGFPSWQIMNLQVNRHCLTVQKLNRSRAMGNPKSVLFQEQVSYGFLRHFSANLCHFPLFLPLCTIFSIFFQKRKFPQSEFFGVGEFPKSQLWKTLTPAFWQVQGMTPGKISGNLLHVGIFPQVIEAFDGAHMAPPDMLRLRSLSCIRRGSQELLGFPSLANIQTSNMTLPKNGGSFLSELSHSLRKPNTEANGIFPQLLWN